MQKLKNFLFYSWWINFWVVLLVVVMFWERPMLRFIGPMAFIAFIGYAFYAMLVTKPAPPTESPKQSSTPDTKSDAEKVS